MYVRIGARIKKAREERGLSQAELGVTLGVTATAVNYYEKGKRKINIDDLYRLAAALDKSVYYFLEDGNEKTGGGGKGPAEQQPELLVDLTGFPVVGTVVAGEPVPAGQTILGCLPFPEKVSRGAYFALLIKGDSMVNAGIREGDLVLIRRQSTVDFNGQIICALVNGDETTLKMFVKETEGSIRLVAANKAYPDIIVSNERDLTIQGVYAGVFKFPSGPGKNKSAYARD